MLPRIAQIIVNADRRHVMMRDAQCPFGPFPHGLRRLVVMIARTMLLLFVMMCSFAYPNRIDMPVR